jgi:uncharacterized LabA/DUF88 family protein
MDRVVIFLDFANVNRAASDHGLTFGYRDLLTYLSEGRTLVDAHAYVPIDPRAIYATDRVIEDLWTDGYCVHSKVGVQRDETYKCNFDVEMTMDIVRTAIEVRPDTVVLGSGDGDFAPLVVELRKRGIRVEICGFVNTTARDLILKCSDFIDLQLFVGDHEDVLGQDASGGPVATTHSE